MGKIKRTLVGTGVAITAASIAGLFTPDVNDAAHHFFVESYVPVADVLEQAMTNAANGKGFDKSKFKTTIDTFETAGGARLRMAFNVGLFGGQRLVAAEACGLLAINDIPIPEKALHDWKANLPLAETDYWASEEVFGNIGDTCLQAYPAINKPGTPSEQMVKKNVTVITGLN